MSCSNIASYAGEFAGIEGIDKFFLMHKIQVACCIDPLDVHILTSDTMITSEKLEGHTFVFCPKHNDFVDITAGKKKE